MAPCLCCWKIGTCKNTPGSSWRQFGQNTLEEGAVEQVHTGSTPERRAMVAFSALAAAQGAAAAASQAALARRGAAAARRGLRHLAGPGGAHGPACGGPD